MTSKPSSTNCPPPLPRLRRRKPIVFARSLERRVPLPPTNALLPLPSFPFPCSLESMSRNRQSGGYSRGVPPLPIPNREVKPTRADGTAPQCGRVGRRRLLSGPPGRANRPGGLFVFKTARTPKINALTMFNGRGKGYTHKICVTFAVVTSAKCVIPL